MRSIRATILLGASLLASTMAQAQTVPEDGVTTQEAATPTGIAVQPSPETRADDGEILVTGSRIKRDPNNSPLPLQIISNAELERNAIASPEQLIGLLTTNGSGADNLASNADVTTGAQRGTNGLSAANLRGQGSAATLVLLNSRRVAAHGLSGAAVDVNQIPFAAIERVEVLKDGASAIYGTDAIGGVINFITRTDYQGVGVQGATDVTEQGDGNIYRVSAIAGFGDLNEQGFNVMGAIAYRWNNILRGSDRDFVNGNQPQRGLSVDTRGTPIATAFALNNGTYLPRGPQGQTGTLLGGTSGTQLLSGLVIPGTTTQATGGINILDLPGGAGCESMDGGMAYDDALWNNVSARYACAWDTGRAAVLQQPIKTLTYFARAVARVAEDHQLSVEVTGSDANSAKSFSNAQVSSNTSNFQVAYPLNSLTAPTYNAVYNAIRGTFPAVAANYGKPIAFRWRCIACGPREYETDTKTIRVTLAAEGPLWAGWDYRAGGSYAKSEATSQLGSGYFYRGTLSSGAYDPTAPTAPGAAGPGLAGLINSGILNPFTLNQSEAALAGLAAVSAEGATLYGGQYEVKQLDYSIAGPLFRLPGGKVQLAAGIDFRSETYSFNGSPAAAANAPVIFLAAFDNVNALRRKNRQVRAAYTEVLVPLFEGFEVTGAVRVDDYGDFGTTTNPKVSVKYRPWEPLMFRGSYNTGFRVPTFNQIFNGLTESPYSGRDLADPVRCPGGVPNTTNPACAAVQPNIYTGGNPNLGPESARQFSAGVVLQPSNRFSLSVDFWAINVDDTIQLLTERELIDNAGLFPDRFIRNAANELVIIDRRWINAGARRTQGLEIAGRGGFDALGGSFLMGIDGTYLLKKREKLTENAAYGPSLIGVFTFAGDLGLRWKHNAFVSYSTDQFSVALTQLYRDGYKNQALPGILAGTVTRDGFNRFVKEYVTYNLAVSFPNLGNSATRLTFGVKNLFDVDPPFAITYDSNTGAGGSWEPRVADPRGRAFTVQADVKF
ncbi:TonB-dependent receptor plug domain-containing protein [Sphingomonas silueang]|uniref:TonB-dependent receptor plug domain-containing protein n=1 Tax=Sphingomonas silueang TaxID=3156617 RepID=UPI0032B48CD6